MILRTVHSFSLMHRVLLTRPKIRARNDDKIHSVLQGSGIAIQELPMLNFELPRDTSLLDSSLHRAAEGAFDYVILASPTAVNFFEQRALELEVIAG